MADPIGGVAERIAAALAAQHAVAEAAKTAAEQAHADLAAEQSTSEG